MERIGLFGGSFDPGRLGQDRKSTRLNSSHLGISYAVFCLKKKGFITWGLFLRSRSACPPRSPARSCSRDACRFCLFFNDTATTEIYTLSLHDALPILTQEGLG